jgi:hypothetical protein
LYSALRNNDDFKTTGDRVTGDFQLHGSPIANQSIQNRQQSNQHKKFKVPGRYSTVRTFTCTPYGYLSCGSVDGR